MNKKLPYTVTIRTAAGTVVRLTNPPASLVELIPFVSGVELHEMRLQMQPRSAGMPHHFSGFGAHQVPPPAVAAPPAATPPAVAVEPVSDPRRSRFVSPF
jgi:hypothetical protein